ncbi:MAG: DnaB-like helicase C-terminal domain-containing protein, partial [Phycisphaerales bacterium]|nr:DnaB-like helicase C-terminal domain-containing protein [Phycisphaerales bacterium]
VAMLHREAYYHLNDETWKQENPEKESLAELIIAKQRNGPTATVKLTWDNACTRFYDWTNTEAPQGSNFAAVVPPSTQDNQRPRALRIKYLAGRG